MMKLVFSMTMIFVAGSLLLGACGSSGNGNNEGKDATPATALARLFINELQPSNQDTITDEVGDSDDWIEIYNDSDTAVDMKV
jgi:hypothetical protein